MHFSSRGQFSEARLILGGLELLALTNNKSICFVVVQIIGIFCVPGGGKDERKLGTFLYNDDLKSDGFPDFKSVSNRPGGGNICLCRPNFLRT